MLILLKKHFLLLWMFKTIVLPNIFVETMIHIFFSIIWSKESSKEQHLFEIENICNIINIFWWVFIDPQTFEQ